MVQERVDHPDHYGGKDNPYETIKVLEAWLDEEIVYFDIGNTIKYVSRAGKKVKADHATAVEATVEDLKKARWYLDHAIGVLEKVVR